MKKFAALLALIYLGFSMLFQAPALAESRSMLDYKVTPKVIYGEGEINGGAESRDLWMDFYEPLYEPLEERKELRPVVIFTHGGAFHRGNPRETFNENGAQDTSPGDYCRKFATRGFVCFAINYRLAQEEPVPSGEGYDKKDLDRNSVKILLDQVNKIRISMDLEPLDPKNREDMKFLNKAVLSAAEDLRTALNHIRNSAERYKIDPEHIVLGGFSAGGITSLNVAHGMHEPVSGAFMLSGGNAGFDILETVTESSDNPPILMFQGQNDLEATFIVIPTLIQHYQEVGVEYTYAWVPAFGHFYTSGATSLSGDGSKMSVEERIVNFLEDVWE
ncbi:MAG: alpha/beta hydrolase [Symploca sp. SIO2E9]|nr:alpha/beta hydrolase [Symploca sp. SIO2E9]